MSSLSVFDAFPGRVAISPVEAGFAACSWSAKTTRNRLTAGTFPFRITLLGGKKVVLLADLAQALGEAVVPQRQEQPERLRRGRKPRPAIQPDREVRHAP